MENVEIEQAQKLILERTKILQETELVGILDAGGRILAQDMTAEIDNPHLIVPPSMDMPADQRM